MKNILILSCSTGKGHDSCAQAIKEYCQLRYVNCEVKDFADFISPHFSVVLSKGHSFLYRRCPWAFRWGYQYGEQHPALFEPTSQLNKLLNAGSDNLYRYILSKSFDIVICTHVFSAIALTHVVKKHKLAVRTAFVATDYSCYPGINATDLQYYFIADENLKNAYVEFGVKKDCIIDSGIPVRQEFWKRIEKADAKRLLNMDPNKKHLLIMSGSMGCGPIEYLVRQIAKQPMDGVEVSVICGTNKRLYQKLSKGYKKNSDIHIIGYTKQMALYMDAADLCLTKPGGISVTEAAVKCLPMAYIDAVGGCERYNMEYFSKNGAAIEAGTSQALVSGCLSLLACETGLKSMKQSLQSFGNKNGAEKIFNYLRDGCL